MSADIDTAGGDDRIDPFRDAIEANKSRQNRRWESLVGNSAMAAADDADLGDDDGDERQPDAAPSSPSSRPNVTPLAQGPRGKAPRGPDRPKQDDWLRGQIDDSRREA